MLYCYDCSKKFKNLKELRHHERVHQRRSFCKECKMYFKTKISHEIHNLKVHPEPRPVRSPQQSQQPRQHCEHRERRKTSQIQGWQEVASGSRVSGTTHGDCVIEDCVWQSGGVWLYHPCEGEVGLISSSNHPALFRATTLYQRVCSDAASV